MTFTHIYQKALKSDFLLMTLSWNTLEYKLIKVGSAFCYIPNTFDEKIEGNKKKKSPLTHTHIKPNNKTSFIEEKLFRTWFSTKMVGLCYL